MTKKMTDRAARALDLTHRPIAPSTLGVHVPAVRSRIAAALDGQALLRSCDVKYLEMIIRVSR